MSNSADVIIEHMFPDVQWTGGSNIHRSIYNYMSACSSGESDRYKLKAVLDMKVPHKIWAFLQERFGMMEWLIEEQAFIDLFMVDLNRLLQGRKTLKTDDRLRNPNTGNLFHKVAIQNRVVGGVRFWYENTGEFIICFRFRLQVMKNEQEEVNVRGAARIKAEQVQEEVVAIYADIMEFNEPPKEPMDFAQEAQKVVEW